MTRFRTRTPGAASLERVKVLPRALDLYEQDFDDACRRLADSVAPRRPDLLVGIATGGAWVAEAMQPHLPGVQLVTVRVQRPGTAAKQALRLGPALSQLPRRVSNVLRWLEVEYRETALRSEVPTDLEERAAEVARASDLPAAAPFERVVIVDDTVDSGRTLRLAAAAVAHVQPSASITTAVLASTWRRPPVQPDVCLFDRTLLRLPWSLDARTAG